MSICRMSDYEAVWVAAENVPGTKRHELFAGIRAQTLGSDLTSVQGNGLWLPLGLACSLPLEAMWLVNQVKDAET